MGDTAGVTDADDPLDDWVPLLDDLARRKGSAREMGGTDKVAKRRATGRLDARARIDHLLDEGSFTEIGTLVGQVPADGVVAGSGTIDGRPVMVGAEDFTTMGGSIGPGSTAKRYRIAELAELDRVPLVMLLEGAGHRPPMPGDPAPARTPTDLIQQARLSGRVPVVTGIMGASAGHGALVAPLSDLSLMTADAAVFTAGPPVVKASLGEDVTKEELGGPEVAVVSGLVQNADLLGGHGEVQHFELHPARSRRFVTERLPTPLVHHDQPLVGVGVNGRELLRQVRELQLPA